MKNQFTAFMFVMSCIITNTITSSAQTGDNNIIITKTANKSVYSLNEKATFIITVSNYSGTEIIVDSIIDELPAGFSYKGFLAGSDINKTNSAIYPTSECKPMIRFVSNSSESGLPQYSVLSGESITLIYTAIACNTAQTNLKTTVVGYRNGSEFGRDANTISVYNVLPLNILNISASHVNNNNVIKWYSLNPGAVKSFILQHSLNGNDWTNIYETKVGCLNTSQSYQYTHIAMAGNACYYRILEESCTGEKQFSKTIYTKESGVNQTFELRGNIINNGTIFVTTFNLGNLYLFNNQGAVVFHQTLSKGIHEIHTNSLPKGIYFLTFNNQSAKIALQ